jgi:hypothetical protein
MIPLITVIFIAFWAMARYAFIGYIIVLYMIFLIFPQIIIIIIMPPIIVIGAYYGTD